MTSFKVNTTCSFLKEPMIKTIEEKFNVKYVFESCLKNVKGEWVNFPAAIFYSEQAHPDGSNYMAAYIDGEHIYVTDGQSAVNGVTYAGLEAEGEVVYSRYRHDYREGKNGAFVDGGRDYFRYGGDPYDDYHVVKFQIENGEIVIDYPTVPDVDYHNQEFN